MRNKTGNIRNLLGTFSNYFSTIKNFYSINEPIKDFWLPVK